MINLFQKIFKCKLKKEENKESKLYGNGNASTKILKILNKIDFYISKKYHQLDFYVF